MEIGGRVTGAIAHQGRLTIALGGCCVGPVRADELHIHGEVQGDVEVAGILHIGNGGRLSGNATCGRLVVDAGGTFLGRNRVGEAGAAEGKPVAASHAAAALQPGAGPTELDGRPEAEANEAAPTTQAVPKTEAHQPEVAPAPEPVPQPAAAPTIEAVHERAAKPAPSPDYGQPETVTFHGFMRKR